MVIGNQMMMMMMMMMLMMTMMTMMMKSADLVEMELVVMMTKAIMGHQHRMVMLLLLRL